MNIDKIIEKIKQTIILGFKNKQVIIINNSKNEIIENKPFIEKDLDENIEKGLTLLKRFRYEEAKAIFIDALKKAEEYKNKYGIVKTKYHLALILREGEANSIDSIKLLNEILPIANEHNFSDIKRGILFELGINELNNKNIEESKAYFTSALDIAEKENDNLEISQITHQLGWIEDHKGNTEEALKLYNKSLSNFLSLYHNEKNNTRIINGIAVCYQYIGLIYDKDGNVELAEANFLKALNWHKKCEYKQNIAKILSILGRINFKQNKYEKGYKYLDEAIEIYREEKIYKDFTYCLQLKGKALFIQGKIKDAYDLFQKALDEISKTNNKTEIAKHLNMMGNYYLNIKDIEKSKECFKKLIIFSEENDLQDGLIDGIEGLAFVENDGDKRKILLKGCIEKLENQFNKTEIKINQAYILGKIGDYYKMMNDFQSSLLFYEKSKSIYELIFDKHGIANILYSKILIYKIQNNKEILFENVLNLKKYLEDTSFYDLIILTNTELVEFYILQNNLEKAKSLLDETLFLCNKYNIKSDINHIIGLQEKLKHLLNLNKPASLKFSELVEELYSLISEYPEYKKNILRFWLMERQNDLFSNYKNVFNVKFMICENNIDNFLDISKKLFLYSDLFLLSVSTEYSEPEVESFPFPMDRVPFFDYSIPFLDKTSGIEKKPIFLKFNSNPDNFDYLMTGEEIKSSVSGNKALFFTGRLLGLPQQAYNLFFERNSNDIKNNKIFFFPYQRCLINDKLLSDLSLSKEFNMIPIYINIFPKSDNVEILKISSTNIPISKNDNNFVETSKIIKKEILNSILSDSSSIVKNITDFEYKNNEICSKLSNDDILIISIYAVKYLRGSNKETHLFFVIENKK